MPKAIDLRIKEAEGMKFEDAMRRILAAPPLPKPAKAKQASKKPAKLPKHAQN